jgi:hypothetical protein
VNTLEIVTPWPAAWSRNWMKNVSGSWYNSKKVPTCKYRTPSCAINRSSQGYE